MKPSEIRARRDIKFSTAHKKEFKRLYLEEKKSARSLARVFKIRNATAYEYARTITDSDCLRSLKCIHRKLDDKKVMEILDKRYCYNISLKELARDYNVSESTISSVTTGASWKHVYSKFTPE
jgi:AraC-like DNA-binding protein